MTTRSTRPALIAAAALAMATAGCSGGSDAPASEDNYAEAPVVNDMEMANLVEPIAPPTATPTPVAAATPEDARAEEAQVQDDADAVGMTARTTRDEADTPATANETQPADVSEKK